MTIEAMKEEINRQILEIEDEEVLEEIKWILDREKVVNPALLSSIEKGIREAKEGKGVEWNKYCGTIRLKESPKEIQKGLRSEWD